jgi:inward rectifier potassium channel
VVPAAFAANVVVTLESVVGLLGFALATGLLFARFSRPTANIVYSDKAIVAPYRGITAFQFRIINGRDSQLINMEARVILTRFEEVNGIRARRYYMLPLERQNVAFFPMAWTIVHPIDDSSPLRGWTEQMLHAASAEFLILLTGVDETFAQSVHSRSSYRAEEVAWGVRFARLLQDGETVPVADMAKFHAVEIVEDWPAAQTARIAGS